MDLVDLVGRGALQQQLHCLDLARHQHAVADEAIANARDHRDLLNLLGEAHGGDQHVVGGLGAADDLEQLHDISRREEVQANDVLRAAGAGGDLVDVEIGGVGRQDRAGLADGVELGEDLLLDVHLLEHRFDDQVAVGEVLELERGGQRGHCLADLLGGHAALGGGCLIVLEHHAGAAIKRVLLGLNDDHGDAGREEVHGDTAPHGAGADHPDLLDRARLHGVGDVIDLGGLALGKEEILLRLGLGAAHQLHE